MFENKKNFVAVYLLAQLLNFPIARAQESIDGAEQEKNIPEESWNAKFQSTYLWQKKPSFDARYTGDRSLLPNVEHSYSLTATAFVGLRLWTGGEIYFNPEMIQAVPFSELHGLGGLSNSEQQKTSGPNPVFYNARLYVKQTFSFGGGQDAAASGPNQLAGMVDRRRLVVSVGKMSIIDVFDNNAYAHDARTQFSNWAFLTHGAFDYAADARGYTIGAAAEYYYDNWAIRVGEFMGPAESNGLPLDTRITKHHGQELEVERGYTIGEQAGKVRLLAFRNKEVMGSFADAIAYAQFNGGVPDVANVRKENFKVGYGMSLEQSLRSDLGMFARASWADGKTETYSFTEIEQSISAGLVGKGERWGRPKDTMGIAFAQDGLSRVHREYLSQGGLGAFIGDGQLNYRPERISEIFYNTNVYKNTTLGFGFQHINNPGYNTDRGPVNIGMVRLHAEL